MTMSKKDYEIVADVLTTCTDDRDDTLLQLAWRFAQENERFRWDLFLEAADYTGDYKVDAHGIIRSPGKLEGENAYMIWASQSEEHPDEDDVYTTYIRWGGNESFKVRYLIDNEGFFWELHGEDEASMDHYDV